MKENVRAGVGGRMKGISEQRRAGVMDVRGIRMEGGKNEKEECIIE